MRVLEWTGDRINEIFDWFADVLGDIFNFFFGWLF